MTMHLAPSTYVWPPRLARLYSEDVRRLEALHAGRLSPGARLGSKRSRHCSRRLVEVGPAKGTKLVTKTIDYLSGVDSDGAASSWSRTLPSRNRDSCCLPPSARPSPGPKGDQGGRVVHRTSLLQCSRSHPSYTVGVPVAYISRHAMTGSTNAVTTSPITADATSVFAFIGVLGIFDASIQKTCRWRHVLGVLGFADGGIAASLHQDLLQRQAVRGDAIRCADSAARGRAWRRPMGASGAGPHRREGGGHVVPGRRGRSRANATCGNHPAPRKAGRWLPLRVTQSTGKRKMSTSPNQIYPPKQQEK